MINHNTFSPDWASPPGETISDILTAKNLTISDFARLMNDSLDKVKKLIQGRYSITVEIAQRLESVLGGSAIFWIQREEQYREDLERINKKTVITHAEWLKLFPIRDMISFGWVKKKDDIDGTLNECLKFFGVPDIRTWQNQYSNALQRVAFRTSKNFSTNEAATTAWLRKGEFEAEKLTCFPWDDKKLKVAIPAIRALTQVKEPHIFIPKLQEIFTECGIALVIARTPSGCRASGATKFISPDKAMILLSFRYLSDDHFWFTLFHEIGHLLLHSHKTIFLENDTDFSCTPEEEVEANNFSESILIPVEYRKELTTIEKTNFGIVRFAKRIGISPGILVGQLQHRGIIPQQHFNKLKIRFKWS